MWSLEARVQNYQDLGLYRDFDLLCFYCSCGVGWTSWAGWAGWAGLDWTSPHIVCLSKLIEKALKVYTEGEVDSSLAFSYQTGASKDCKSFAIRRPRS